VSTTNTEGPIAARSSEALNEGDNKDGGEASWQMTTNSTSLTDVSGSDDGIQLLRMEEPPANMLVLPP
jgi:hypothetical protein